MVFSYKDCIAKKLLRKVPFSRDKAIGSFNKSRQWLVEAEKTLKSTAYNSSVMASYLVMFHSSRAFLFLDGYREKSHACVARFLEEKYVRKGELSKKWVDILDLSRETRHNNQYDLSYIVSESEAEKALNSAREFLKVMEKLFDTVSK